MINVLIPIHDTHNIVTLAISNLILYRGHGMCILALSRAKGHYFPPFTMVNSLISIPTMQDLKMVPIISTWTSNITSNSFFLFEVILIVNEP